MSEVTVAVPVEVTPSLSVPVVEKTSPASKVEIYSRIAGLLNEKVQERFAVVQKRVLERHKDDVHMRRVFGDEDGRSLMVMMWTELMDLLVSPNSEGQIVEGTTVGLPAGLGSLELLTAGATKKKTPQGAMIDVKKRWRVKWNPGKAVQEKIAALPKPAE